jgi:hypothetical protein
MTPEVSAFADWFRTHSQRLFGMASDDVAGEVAEQLCRLDARLGVEAEGLAIGKTRDIIFTAYSDPDAFPTVRAIVAAIGSGQPGDGGHWNVHALKPARGFDFAITPGGQEKLQAGGLRFRRIATIEYGFELLYPGTCVSGSGAEEAAWLIVETGIGEELAAKIGHLEFPTHHPACRCLAFHPIASATEQAHRFESRPDSRAGTNLVDLPGIHRYRLWAWLDFLPSTA